MNQLAHEVAEEKATFTGFKNRNLRTKEKIGALKLRYAKGNNATPSFLGKISEIERVFGYKHWQRVCGDGNCFYRAVIYSYINYLRKLAAASGEISGLINLRAIVEQCGEDKVRFNGSLVERQGGRVGGLDEAKVVILELIDLLVRQPMTEWSLENTFIRPNMKKHLRRQSKDTDWAAVCVARQIASDYIRTNKEWHPLVDAQFFTVEKYCKDYVERFGVEAEQLAIPALPMALGINVRMVYLDRSDDVPVRTIDIPENRILPNPQSQIDDVEELEREVHILFTPGHYDILYPASSNSKPDNKRKTLTSKVRSSISSSSSSSSGLGPRVRFGGVLNKFLSRK